MIMEWFKHDILSMVDTSIQILISAGGLEYYGFFWCTVEAIYQNDGQISRRGLLAKARTAKMSEAAADKAIDLMIEIGLITVDAQGNLKSERITGAIGDFQKAQAQKSEHGKLMVNARWNKAKNVAKSEIKTSESAINDTGSILQEYYQNTNSILQHTTSILADTESILDKEEDKEIDKEVLKKEVNKKKNFSSSSLSIDALIKQQDTTLQDHWKAFVNMRKRIKAPLTVEGLQLSITNLDKMAATTEERAAIIDQSVQKSWRGLFPIKDNKTVSFTPTARNEWAGTKGGELKI